MSTTPRSYSLACVAALAVACTPSGPLPLPVRLQFEPGDVFEVVLEESSDTRLNATAEARVTVGSRRPDYSTLAVLLRGLTIPSQGKVLSDEPFTVVVGRDPAIPVLPTLTVTDGSRDLELYQGLLNTFDLTSCVLPSRPHAAGDTWTETISGVTREWQVGVPELQDGVTWVRYHHSDRAPGEDGAPGPVVFDAELRIRVDDGFTGECRVTTRFPDLVSHKRISSRRTR